ncbi:homogentisate 1,2-dioxygenase [Paracoccidioides brasiliensis Pb03]|nr:homogentisate 1,2-dioxygenase [Paracoccidioides brasiliensis Pb03]
MPVSNFSTKEKYTYLNGFGSYHESEAIEGALPVGQNSPQKPPYGLYAEKLSGTAFTAPRHENQQSWLYRILPSAAHEPFKEVDPTTYHTSLKKDTHSIKQIPNQLRWSPFDLDEHVDWTEFGHLLVRPNEICVIPRGVKYRVTLPSGPVRGYICELYQGHFQLPELGPIGSNCLANARDFQAPTASFIDDEGKCNNLKGWSILSKFNNSLFIARQKHTPFDVVAWHGTYYPYKYDLGRFNTIGSISYDHPDPSIFTVLTGPSDHAGTAIADFVIFPPRWLVAEGTFRPPWYHRNTMSEFMGLICGDYDAKSGDGFRPAGGSLHNVMSAHGPDAMTHEAASNAPLLPKKVGEGSLAFMFESTLMVGVSEWGLKTCQKVQEDYNNESWTPLKRHFQNPNKQK